MTMLLPTLLSCMLLMLVSSQREGQEDILEKFFLNKTEQAEVNDLAEEQLRSERKNETQFLELDRFVSRPGTSINQHRQFTLAAEESISRGQAHRLNIIKVEQSLKMKEVPIESVRPLLEKGFGPKVFCGDSCTCDINTPYRTADGSCNNLKKTTWGMASIPMRRWLYPAYDDGVASPRQLSALGGSSFLPSARKVSTKVHKPSIKADEHKEFTHMLMQWGQFLDHDITSTPTQQRGGYASSSLACCTDINFSGSGITQAELDARPGCFPIKIDLPDRHFNTTCMNFMRSIQVENSKCTAAPAEQINDITAYIDASNVYGSSQKEQNALRTFSMGLLRDVSPHGYLPKGAPSSCTTPSLAPTDYCFKAGDHRVNENPGLQSMHTIFMREHNRIAGILKDLNCHWNDERLFQETRKIVGALVQKITYDEYLPIVLGNTVMTNYGLKLALSGHTSSYKVLKDASIRNAFATAAFRMGHSMIQDTFGSRKVDYTDLGDDTLKDVFGNTHQILTATNREVGPYCRGLAFDCVQPVDSKLSKQVTDHLFEDPSGKSFDLAALNIQRGRDHGIPPYLHWRRFCGNTNNVADFPDLWDTHNLTARSQLGDAYTSVEDIDLFPGAISEEPVPGGLVGPTFACLLAKQFNVLKEGDRFWFEEKNDNVHFTTSQLAELRKASLSRVVCDNTDTEDIQENAFIKDVDWPCDKLPAIDLTPWKEELGQWTSWSAWRCEKDRIQRRYRTCKPCNCGCEGPNVESKPCFVTAKPCGWTEWGPCESNYRKRECKCPGSSKKFCFFQVAINQRVRTLN